MQESSTPSELTIGTHRVHIDGDAVLIRWIGTPEYEDVRTVHLYFEQVVAKYGHLFVINDMRHSGLPSAQTRKWMVEWMVRYPLVVFVVNFGASLPIRVLQAMIFRALSLVGNRPAVDVVHCASEAEALAVIAARRRQLTAIPLPP